MRFNSLKFTDSKKLNRKDLLSDEWMEDDTPYFQPIPSGTMNQLMISGNDDVTNRGTESTYYSDITSEEDDATSDDDASSDDDVTSNDVNRNEY